MRSVSSSRAPSPLHDHAPVARPQAWAQGAVGRTSTALLLLGPDSTDAVEALKRCFATVLPAADVLPFAGQDRETLVRRMFAEIKADAYVVADQAREPLAIARAVAAVERDGADLVIVSKFRDAAFADPGDHLLTLALNYLFGCGAGPVDAAAVACSRRFAQSYAGDGTALDLTLHALRRRMPIGEVEMHDLAGADATARPTRKIRDWLALAGLLVRLFAEERPRRTFGLAGFAAIEAGIASATPAIRIHDWHAACCLAGIRYCRSA